MISIDRAASRSIQDQLVEQLRFEIANGRYQVDETLPSTRVLAKQVGVSFHTVRKAYHQLDEEGIVEARPGSGFVVTARKPLSKEERVERGAAVVQEAVQHLVGLGLDDGEIEYLVQEQLNLLDDRVHRHKLLFAASFREMAELGADQVSTALQLPVASVLIEDLPTHQDVDHLFVRCAELQKAHGHVPRAESEGVVTYLSPNVLSRIARLLTTETLGLVTRYADAVPHLMSEIRQQTGFGGQMLGASIDDGVRHLEQFLQQLDVLVYTPHSRHRLRPLLDPFDRPHHLLNVVVSPDSLESIRQAVPT